MMLAGKNTDLKPFHLQKLVMQKMDGKVYCQAGVALSLQCLFHDKTSSLMVPACGTN